MKREIKFRAWDGDAEMMIYSDGKENNIDTADYWWEFSPIRVGVITGESGGNSFEPPEPIVTYYEDIMQFTGLKDKNGKEIYEGDLISESGSKPYEVIWQYHSVQWIMQYTGEGRSYRDMAYDYALKNYEVMGNIYENPELL